jgi:SHS2 domain-containing protein
MTVEAIEHTADVGIQVSAPDLTTLFDETACAMRDLMVAPQALTPRRTQTLELRADDWSELLMDWLRELLYLWHAEKKLLATVQIETHAPFCLRARIGLDDYDATRHILEHEIKAVTWHQFGVQQTPNGWQCRVIFDV